MAIPFITSPATLRWLRTSVKGGLTQGLSLVEIQSSIRDAGIRVSRRDLGFLYNNLYAIQQQGLQVRSLNFLRAANPFRIPFSTERLTRQFRFTIKHIGYNVVTGESETRFTRLSSDDNLTRAEIEDLAEEDVLKGDSFPNFIPTSTTYWEVEQSGDKGTWL